MESDGLELKIVPVNRNDFKFENKRIKYIFKEGCPHGSMGRSTTSADILASRVKRVRALKNARGFADGSETSVDTPVLECVLVA